MVRPRVDTIQESVRIPQDLIDKIDTDFVNTGLFTSRADFIASAIRYYYENVVYQFSKYAKFVTQEKRKDPNFYPGLNVIDAIQILIIHATRMNRINHYAGEKKVVLLRLSPGLVESYVRFIKETGFYRNKADFYNYAIEVYLDAQYYVDTIMDGIDHRNAERVLFVNDELEFMNRRTPILETEPYGPIGTDTVNDMSWDNWLDKYDGPLPTRFDDVRFWDE